jgi:uncharacterized protein YjbJ (UPF0337 family)
MLEGIMSVVTKLSGNWHEMKGKIKEHWGELTNNEIDRIRGKKEKLVGTLMAKYNLSNKEAEREVAKFWH